MTDKVQKIREEVVRMHNLLPVMDGNNISLNYADRICTSLEMYIDSMQEEPVSEKKCMFTKDGYTDEDRKVLCDGCEEECKYAQKEEPVSEEFEKKFISFVDATHDNNGSYSLHDFAQRLYNIAKEELEEPVSDECIYNRTLEERQKSCKFCSAACQVRIKEESVSEDLEEASKECINDLLPDTLQEGK